MEGQALHTFRNAMTRVTMTPLPLLPVEPNYLDWHGHRIAHYQMGTGRPILLVHSINAAASAFEMRGPFRGLSSEYTVHACDLLGYGNSDRPARRYRDTDYIDQIGVMLEQIAEPSRLIASSLGAAYAVAAAERWPERVRALILVCPTGMRQLNQPPGRLARACYALLRGRLGQAIFERLTSRSGSAFFLRSQAYYDAAAISQETLDSFYTTCRRPGAYHAPICFITTMLNCDIRTSFPRLRQPILLVWGRQATTTPLRYAQAFLKANPQAQLEVIDRASMLVQDERPDEFNQICRTFLAERT